MFIVLFVTDLARLYRLYKKFPEDLQPIADLCHEHIKKEGGEVVDRARPEKKAEGEDDEKKDDEKSEEKDEEKADEKEDDEKKEGGDVNHALVRNLIGLHARYGGIVNDCFEKAQVTVTLHHISTTRVHTMLTMTS
jgi:hypothetical protein